jgi:uncharacterized protein (DUF1501 family)
VDNGRVLVVLQLAGGNDGLNTVVPYSQGRYYDVRGTLGIPQEQVLTLNDRIGLHPSLAPLKSTWDSDRLAIVEGVGYPNPDRSHFRSMEIWHTANPEGVSYQGWLGRYLDVSANDDRNLWRAVSVGSGLTPSLISQASYVPTLQGIDTYKLQTDARYSADAQNKLNAWTALYAQAAAQPGYMPFISNTGTRAYQSALELQEIAADYKPAVEYPQTPLGNAMKLIAQLVTSRLGTGLAYVTLGGFDTHAQEATEHAELLTTLAEAMAAFSQDMEAQGQLGRVALMTWSEFGRRVNANNSLGTDHGTAAPLFILSGGVKGGTYGAPSSLTDLDDNGDLKFTTDFRSVYATVLEEWLGVASSDVLGRKYETLRIFG